MYTLHITRKNDWLGEGEDITLTEFELIQKELKDPYFQYIRGNIYVINPNSEYIKK